MASENHTTDLWDDYITRMPLLRGLKIGLFFAAGVTVIALVRVAIGVVALILGDPSRVLKFGSEGHLMLWVIAGYVVGFGVAGVLFAAVSHVRNRVVRYTISGLLCGTSIYGAIGIIPDLMDGKTPDWTEIAGIAGLLGLV